MALRPGWGVTVSGTGGCVKTKHFVMAMLALLAAGVAQAQVNGVPPPKNATQAMYMSIFLYGRASYFHAIVQQRHCDQMDANTVSAIDQRFENVRAQLVARYGDAIARADKPVNGPQAPCLPGTLASYSNHVAEVEQIIQESSTLH
jgi:hypothetical protein